MEYRRVTGIHREYMGLIGPYGNRGERPKGRRPAPPFWSELDKGRSPLFLLPLPLFPNPTRRGETKGRGRRKWGTAPPFPSPIRTRGRGGARPTLAAPLSSHQGPCGPLTVRGRFLVTLRHSGFLRNHPEHFRCPNIVVQYINLYVLTISRLLVMSVITSRTPNNLRNIMTHKLIIPIVIEC